MRTYSEREIADIIERAAERQAEADRREGAPGLTLDEIERLGADAGIDPAHLRAAAEEVGTHGKTYSGDSGMSRTHVHVERWVDGPLTSEAWEDTVAHLRQTYGADLNVTFGLTGAGEVQQVGQSHEWRHTSSLGVQTHVTVSPRGDRTRLRITQLVGLSSTRNEGIAYGGFIAGVIALIASVSGLVGTDSGLVAAAVFVLTSVLASAITIPTVTRLDANWRRKKLRQLGELADDLAPILAPSTGTQLATAETTLSELGNDERTAAPQLDLDALGDAPETEAVRTNRIGTQ